MATVKKAATMTIRLPLSELRAWKAAAKKQGVTLTMWVRNAMAKGITP